MGKFLKPRGLNGEIRANIFNEIDSELKIGKTIWLKTDAEFYCSHIIESIVISGDKSLIKLLDCNNRENADSIQGLVFYLSRNDFCIIKEGQHYLVDIIGSQVLDVNKKCIGVVIDILVIPAQYIIVVKHGKEEFLIPYVDAYVTFFDVKKKNLIVKNVEELRS